MGLRFYIALGCILTGASQLGLADSGGDHRAATQNPISSMYSLPFKFTFDNGADNGDANILNIQPVLPVTVGDWNLVSRFIIGWKARSNNNSDWVGRQHAPYPVFLTIAVKWSGTFGHRVKKVKFIFKRGLRNAQI